MTAPIAERQGQWGDASKASAADKTVASLRDEFMTTCASRREKQIEERTHVRAYCAEAFESA